MVVVTVEFGPAALFEEPEGVVESGKLLDAADNFLHIVNICEDLESSASVSAPTPIKMWEILAVKQ